MVCQSQPLDNLPGYTITWIAATTIADSETEKEALIWDFPEVTKILKAQIPVKSVEHIIKIMKDPPFEPIYNLSETKLASLREYLNKGLDRGWIQLDWPDRTEGLGLDRTGPVCKQSSPKFWDQTEVWFCSPVRSGLRYGPVLRFGTGLCTVSKKIGTGPHVVPSFFLRPNRRCG